MYYIKFEESFDSAHFLKDYNGKCGNIHGHRWRIVAQVRSEDLGLEDDRRGMVHDFSEVKDVLKELCDAFDHTMIYEAGTLKEATIAALEDEGFEITEVSFRPTAENFARYFYDRIKEKGYDAHRVEVYETPNNCAVYEEPR